MVFKKLLKMILIMKKNYCKNDFDNEKNNLKIQFTYGFSRYDGCVHYFRDGKFLEQLT